MNDKSNKAQTQIQNNKIKPITNKSTNSALQQQQQQYSHNNNFVAQHNNINTSSSSSCSSSSPVPSSQNKQLDLTRINKTLRQSQTAAFTTQLFYFSIKILFCYILIRYKSVLNGNFIDILVYGFLLLGNSWAIVSTGKKPGFQQKKQEENQGLFNNNMNQEQQRQQININQNSNNNNGNNSDSQWCEVCQHTKKLRTKHCYRCGHCVRKFDHHCPWIGACVGQANQCRFVVMLFGQTIQALVSFYICFQSMRLYQYKQRSSQNGSLKNNNLTVNDHTKQPTHSSSSQGQLQQYFSQQFGVFAIFAVFMFLYIIFVFSLFVFHLYLVLTNSTTTQLMYRSKSKYLQQINGNPFTRGPINNLMMAINVPEDGHIWKIQPEFRKGQAGDFKRERTFLEKVWSNQYYDCC